jgi:hypothetical protein
MQFEPDVLAALERLALPGKRLRRRGLHIVQAGSTQGMIQLVYVPFARWTSRERSYLGRRLMAARRSRSSRRQLWGITAASTESGDARKPARRLKPMPGREPGIPSLRALTACRRESLLVARSRMAPRNPLGHGGGRRPRTAGCVDPE